MSSIKTVINSTSSVRALTCASILLLTPVAVQAQDAKTADVPAKASVDDQGVGTEILVTARKRNERYL